MSTLANSISCKIIGEKPLTQDIFPSYVLEPKKTVENISWFLNPIEEPPQKFLQLQNKNSSTNVYSDLLLQEDFIVKNADLESFYSNNDENPKINLEYQEGYFNIIFSLANENFITNFDFVFFNIHKLLKPSSYLIFEIKVDENFERVLDSIESNFESVNLLSPWSDYSTNPFSPFDSKKTSYCWVAALSKGSDKDPGEWLENL